jgi:uncharacterized membrane protein
MNLAHLHLLLNHFPIIGTLVGCAILVWGIISSDTKIKHVAVWLILVMSLIAIPAYFTGEAAEESVENLAGITESSIENHENAALVSVIIHSVAGFFALLVLFARQWKSQLMKPFFMIFTVLSFTTAGAMIYTGLTGGKIRHAQSGQTTRENTPAGDSDED